MFTFKLTSSESTQRVHIPDTWNEISFEQALNVKDLVEEKMPKPYKDQFFKSDDEVTEPTQKDTFAFMKFQCQYLSILSGVDAQIFEHLTPIKTDEFIINAQWLFERCNKFMAFPDPEQCQIRDHIEVDGRKYYRDLPTVDMMGRVDKLNNVDYATFSAGMLVNTLIDKVYTGDIKNKELLVLTAHLFRPRIKHPSRFWQKDKYSIEAFDNDTATERANIFLQASAADVFGSYFFLIREQQKRLTNSKSYLKKTINRIKRSPKLYLIKALMSIKWRAVGIFLPIKSRWMAFLHARKNHQSNQS